MNHLRPLLAGTVAAFLATTALGPSAARAADTDPVRCTIESTSPDAVSIGIIPQPVQFAVHTDCDGSYPVNWELLSDQYVGSNASWLMMRNWDEPGAGKYTFVESPQGYFTIDPVHRGVHPGNAMAGEHPLSSNAFVDIDGDGYSGSSEPRTYARTTVRLRRATTFGDSFTASSPAAGHPAERHPLVHFTGSLQRADWDSGTYQDLGAWVTLQFQRSGSTRWKDVTRAWNDGSAHLTAQAKRPGTWRYHYDGDDISGNSNSNGVFVDVAD